MLYRTETVVATLPDPLEPSTVYYVRSGTGFDLYVSDITGSIAYLINKQEEFLPNPDLTDFTDSLYFYFGWESVNGGWLVQRQVRADGSSLDANEASNGLYTNLTNAWSNRVALSYS